VNVQVEQRELSDARQKFSTGDYSFIKSLQGQEYHGKRPFSELLAQAGSEEKLLGDLQARRQSNDWQTVKTKLADPGSANFTNKPPFRDLNDWATKQSAAGLQKETLTSLDGQLQIYLVWFNILKPTDPRITSPDARKEHRQDGGIGTRDELLDRIARLKDEYRKGGWLNQDRERDLDELKDTVNRRE
jgi:hypothetical protein